MDGNFLNEQTLQALGWPEIIRFLSQQARSPMTADRCRALPLWDDPAAVSERLSAVWEGVVLLKQAGDLPISFFPDLRPVFVRAAKGAALEGAELRGIFDFLEQVRAVRAFLLGRKEAAPHLLQWGVSLEPLDPLRKKIGQSIDEEGQVRESATPALKALKAEAARAREGIISRMESMLRSPRYEKLLQESYYTEREGRYVLPFKIAHQNKEGGVVHDLSASGATAFVEPRELVAPNNRLRVAQLSVAREVERILSALSGEAGAAEESLRRNIDVMVELDLVRAEAALAERIGGICPVIYTDGRIDLREVRHPLLLLHKGEVVPNDIVLDAAQRALVLSGPNTGGKTVILKTIGLLALMVRAGLPIPCEAGSGMALFSEVIADIGDDQDLSRDLSSFSAHLGKIRAILSAARPGALVLLDELVTSTDPTEGAALAEAILIEMVDRGLKVVTTTHYPSLKGLAQADPRFLNASLGFDFERMAPTFRLLLGVPGRSAALEVAERLGLSRSILEEAKQRLGRTEQALERLIADLERERRQAEKERERSTALRQEIEAAAEIQRAGAERAALSEKEIQKKIRQKVAEAAASARSEISALVESLRSATTLSKIREGAARLAEIEKRAAGPASSPIAPIPLQAGGKVEVIPLGKTGVLLDPPSGAKKVRVRIGNQILSLSPDSIEGLPEESKEEVDLPKAPPSGSAGTFKPELDLHGRRVEEGLELLERFLDRAMLSEEREVRLIHGHGSGKLKKGIRDYLKGSPYVERFRAGDLLEGGDGVTIVTLSS